MEYCYKCGKNLTFTMGDGTECTVAGLSLTVSWEDGGNPEAAEHLKANLGRYAPEDEEVKSMNFKFCFECQMDSLMLGHPQKHGGGSHW